MPNCAAHHWMIEAPSGGQLSVGRCKNCGEERSDFRNTNKFWTRKELQTRGIRMAKEQKDRVLPEGPRWNWDISYPLITKLTNFDDLPNRADFSL
jgi:hypothetical protein